jgi:hypothetical protein
MSLANNFKSAKANSVRVVAPTPSPSPPAALHYFAFHGTPQVASTPATPQLLPQRLTQPPTEADADDLEYVASSESKWLTYVATCPRATPKRPVSQHGHGVSDNAATPAHIPATTSCHTAHHEAQPKDSVPDSPPQQHFPLHAVAQVLLTNRAPSKLSLVFVS